MPRGQKSIIILYVYVCGPGFAYRPPFENLCVWLTCMDSTDILISQSGLLLVEYTSQIFQIIYRSIAEILSTMLDYTAKFLTCSLCCERAWCSDCFTYGAIHWLKCMNQFYLGCYTVTVLFMYIVDQ